MWLSTLWMISWIIQYVHIISLRLLFSMLWFFTEFPQNIRNRLLAPEKHMCGIYVTWIDLFWASLFLVHFMYLFLDAIAFPSTYPCQWVSGSVSEWLIVSNFRDSCRIYRACELVSVAHVLTTLVKCLKGRPVSLHFCHSPSNETQWSAVLAAIFVNILQSIRRKVTNMSFACIKCQIFTSWRRQDVCICVLAPCGS